MQYEHVFTPIDINGVTLPNRIARSAHGTGLSRGVAISDDLIAYHERRARGGVGLSILEIAGVHPSTGPGGIQSWDDRIIDGYRRLIDAVRPHGMKMFHQLWHGGHHNPGADGGPPWAPSYVTSARLAMPPVPMTKAQIEEIALAFGQAARRAKEGGLDGVEIHGAHGYLVGQFLSPLTNRREDEYGGSFENRMRFAREVIAAIRDQVGRDFAVGIRLSGSEATPGGMDVEDAIDIAKALEGDGQLDFFDISLGGYLAFSKLIGGMHEAHGYELPTSAPVTRELKTPTLVTGRILSIAEADRVIAEGQADVVFMVRATIADPDIVLKAREGREEETRPCIGCNQGCVGGVFSAAARVGCLVNIEAGQELRYTSERLAPSAAPKRVLVAGGGPAGLEAARTAALRGHHVTICEAGPDLGGQARIARMAPTRFETANITDWLERELRRLEVDIRLNTPVDDGLVAREKPDVVVVATGSTPKGDGFNSMRPGYVIPGVELPHVTSSWQVLTGAVAPGRRAVVFDELGHYEAMGVAEFLRRAGSEVTFVTRHSQMGHLLEGAMTTEPAYARLTGDGFELITRSHVAAITGESVTVRSVDSNTDREIVADLVVLVSWNEPQNALAERLKAQGVEVQLVGDALAPRFMQAAIHEGHRAALAV